MKQIIHGAACALTALLSLSSFALQAAEAIPAERYHYGMQLDVQKVLAVSEAQPKASPQLCQVVEARMDYLDSAGETRSLTYLKHSSTCRDGD
ncbi:DUF2790 domain-containing protein [Pseudomonas sp. CrR25]|nr:DUF2790 domain-containing protein [Pseudomonas sp. CrR25]